MSFHVKSYDHIYLLRIVPKTILHAILKTNKTTPKKRNKMNHKNTYQSYKTDLKNSEIAKYARPIK
jgi:hypothetical protein